MSEQAQTLPQVEDSTVKETEVNAVERTSHQGVVSPDSVRRRLNLPKRSGEIDPTSRDLDKRTTLNKYKERREQERLGRGERGFFSGAYKEAQQEKDVRRHLAGDQKEGFISKTERAIAVQRMRLAGVRNASRVMADIQAAVPEFKPGMLKDKELMHAIREMRDPGKGLQRLEKMGYVADANVLRSTEFVKVVNEISSVSDEQFEQTYTELDRYFFIAHERLAYNDQTLSGSVKSLSRIIAQGDLTPDQKQKLEEAYNFAILTGHVPYFNLSGRLVSDPAERGVLLDVALNGLPEGKRYVVNRLVEEYVYGAADGGIVHENFYRNLGEIIDRGKADTVLALSDSWDMRNFWGCLNYSSRITNINRAVEDLDSTAAFYQDKEKMEWVALYQDICGALPGAKFSPSALGRYEDFYENRESMAGLAVLANELGADFKNGVKLIQAEPQVGIERHISLGREFLDKLNNFEPNETSSATSPDYLFWRYVKYNFSYATKKDIPLLAYLAFHKDEVLDGFAYGPAQGQFGMRAGLIEKIFEAKVPIDRVRFVGECQDPENFSPKFFIENIGMFNTQQQIAFIQNLSDEKISQLNQEDQQCFKFLKEVNRKWEQFPFPYGFFIHNKDRFADWVDGSEIKPAFYYEYLRTDSLSKVWVVADLLTEEAMAHFSPEEQAFWTYWKNCPDDLQNFLIKSPQGTFTKDGTIDSLKIQREFIADLLAYPENCSTYESMTNMFNYINRFVPPGFERGKIYLQIAEAHKLRTISQRTEVESFGALREAFVQLYHPDMCPFEKLSWQVLSRHLPITTNESMRTAMRNQALVVEDVSQNKLAWVHQSVHNYASVHQVAYLEAFQKYLNIGDSLDLNLAKANYQGEARAPDYTEEDRQQLLGSSQLGQELARLIEDAKGFYEVHPDVLDQAAINLGGALPRELMSRVVKLGSDLHIASASSEITTNEQKDAVVGFCLGVANVRERLRDQLGTSIKRADISGAERNRVQRNIFLMDTVLDDMSQKIFTQYKDYLLANQNTLSQADWLQAGVVYGEIMRCSILNGELPAEASNLAQKLGEWRNYAAVTPLIVHARLMEMVIFQEKDMNEFWGKFADAAAPELAQMLGRMNFSADGALERARMTDLVEFKKSSTAYVLEPLGELLREKLQSVEADFVPGRMPSPVEVFAQTGQNILEYRERKDPEVNDFLRQLTQERMPQSVQEASLFIGKLDDSSSAAADKLARMVVGGYMDRDNLERKYVKIEKNGHRIELYPLSYYGVDMAVVVVDGKRVGDPANVIETNFSVLPVQKRLLREGD